jgi:hypothetical protein
MTTGTGMMYRKLDETILLYVLGGRELRGLARMGRRVWMAL